VPQETCVLERLYEAWNRGDVAALVALCDPEIVVRPTFGVMLSSTVYRGHAGVEDWYAETYEPWAELRAVPHRFIEAGERTLVLVELHARVAGGQVEVTDQIAHLVRVENGKIVQLDGYEDPDAALTQLKDEA
jgi:ketosteroid isomerase-like protein